MKIHSLEKALLVAWEMFLHENNYNYNFHTFSYKFVFVLFLSLVRNQRQESNLKQVGDLVTKNISVFYIASRTLLQCHTKFNRLLWRNFLTCYSSLYYSSMVKRYYFFPNTLVWGGQTWFWLLSRKMDGPEMNQSRRYLFTYLFIYLEKCPAKIDENFRIKVKVLSSA